MSGLSIEHRLYVGKRRLTGGVVFLNKPQLILPNHRCCLTSLAPLWLPSRRVSSLASRRVIISRHSLTKHSENNAGVILGSQHTW